MLLLLYLLVASQACLVSHASNEAFPRRDSHARLPNAEDTQHGNHQHRTPSLFNRSCAELKNKGTHFTVEIGIGTPPQKFDVVADTGSDAIIVPSCACVNAGYCHNGSRCFTGGNNRSSSFSIQQGPRGPPALRMMFGSGPVQAVVASDIVSVGGVRTRMNDGLLLMTDHLLKIKGPFEGILGLGLPASDAKEGLYKESSKSLHPHKKSDPLHAEAKEFSSHKGANVAESRILQKGYEKLDSYNMRPLTLPAAFDKPIPGRIFVKTSPDKAEEAANPDADKDVSFVSEATGKGNESAEPDTPEIVVRGFMETRGVSRFSMCFNDAAPGVFRIDSPKPPVSHGSVGHVHWGLELRGISVGGVSAPVSFCREEDMEEGQTTPCGAIPDSGTTFIMAPKQQLITLYSDLCEKWDRCKQNFTAKERKRTANAKHTPPTKTSSGLLVQKVSKALSFQQLIYDCNVWLSDTVTLAELPDIHIHVAGSNKTKQALHLSSWAYVIEVHEKEFQYVNNTDGSTGDRTAGNRRVCSPAFSTMEYNTEKNGPVWILGTPLFYAYQVGYDLTSKPPSMSFSDEECGSCKPMDDKHIFISQAVNGRDVQRHQRPRKAYGPFLRPNFDLSRPL